MLWNEASRTIRGWPQLEVQVPSEKLQYSFDWDQFPSTLLDDLEAYIQHLGNEDPFADDYLSPLRPATVANRRKQIRQIASAAVHGGCVINEVTRLADLVTAKNVERELRFFWERAGQEKTEYLYQFATLLRSIARHWAKASPSDLAYIEARCRAFAVKKHGMVEKNRALLMQFDDPANVDALLSLPGSPAPPGPGDGQGRPRRCGPGGDRLGHRASDQCPHSGGQFGLAPVGGAFPA